MGLTWCAWISALWWEKNAVERVRAQFTASQRSQLFSSQAPPITIVADLEEVRAAVSNLIDNAVKYSGKDVKVRVATEQAEGFVVMRVQDAGVGIPKTELKRVFKRFHRVPGPLASRVKGTGWDSSSYGSVAKRHGGRAWAGREGDRAGKHFFPAIAGG